MPYLGNEGRENLTTSFHTDMTFLSVKNFFKRPFFKSRKGHVETEGPNNSPGIVVHRIFL